MTSLTHLSTKFFLFFYLINSKWIRPWNSLSQIKNYEEKLPLKNKRGANCLQSSLTESSMHFTQERHHSSLKQSSFLMALIMPPWRITFSSRLDEVWLLLLGRSETRRLYDEDDSVILQVRASSSFSSLWADARIWSTLRGSDCSTAVKETTDVKSDTTVQPFFKVWKNKEAVSSQTLNIIIKIQTVKNHCSRSAVKEVEKEANRQAPTGNKHLLWTKAEKHALQKTVGNNQHRTPPPPKKKHFFKLN